MKRNIAVNIIIILLLLTSCDIGNVNQVNNNDWSYYFDNGYSVSHVNSRCIIFGKDDGEYSQKVIVPAYISEFSYNYNYVCLKRVDVADDITIPIDKSNPEYYIVDIIKNITYGPFDSEKYTSRIDELNIKNLSSWTSTYPRPDGAVFY